MLQIPIYWQKYQLDNLVKGSFSRLILSYVLYIKMFPNLNVLELDFWQTVFNDCPSHIISSQRGPDKTARISSSSHSSSFIFVKVSNQNFWFFSLKRSLMGESETLHYAIRRHIIILKLFVILIVVLKVSLSTINKERFITGSYQSKIRNYDQP